MNFKRVTIIAGHYGSGKTNIAINLAMAVKNSGQDVCVADLDIVNPYYRTKDSEKELESAGIHLISSEFANSNVDLPAMPDELYSIIDNKDRYAVLDVGGDDRGALALGRFVPAICAEENYEMLFVINCYRPLTSTPEETVAVMHEIEYACGLKFTAIINNSNLGSRTCEEDVAASFGYAKKISLITGLPIKLTTVKESIFDNMSEGFRGKIQNAFPMKLQNKRIWNE